MIYTRKYTNNTYASYNIYHIIYLYMLTSLSLIKSAPWPFIWSPPKHPIYTYIHTYTYINRQLYYNIHIYIYIYTHILTYIYTCMYMY